MSNEVRDAKILTAAIKYADKKIAELVEDVQPQPVQAPVEQTPEPVSEPELEPKTKVPDAPKPKKTGKVPDFKVN